MDWRKTEIIFIITFLLVDIFLGVVWFNKKLADNTDKLSSSSIQENLRNDLAFAIEKADPSRSQKR